MQRVDRVQAKANVKAKVTGQCLHHWSADMCIRYSSSIMKVFGRADYIPQNLKMAS